MPAYLPCPILIRMRNVYLIVFITLFTLTGCSTLEGLQNDLTDGYRSITRSIAGTLSPLKEERKRLPVYDGACPPVSVRPDLAHLVDFYNPSRPSESTKMSEVAIKDVQNTCRVEKGGIVMQIDLTLSGKTGPRARARPTDKPSFAYPYFVAVTDLQGNILSKEIFAASLSYNADQSALTQTESVFQNMPVPDKAAGQSFQVVVGFQLTEEQLAYNQTVPPAPPLPARR